MGFKKFGGETLYYDDDEFVRACTIPKVEVSLFSDIFHKYQW